MLEETKAREREGNELYFFYGSLMDPRVLQRVLGLPGELTSKTVASWPSRVINTGTFGYEHVADVIERVYRSKYPAPA